MKRARLTTKISPATARKMKLLAREFGMTNQRYAAGVIEYAVAELYRKNFGFSAAVFFDRETVRVEVNGESVVGTITGNQTTVNETGATVKWYQVQTADAVVWRYEENIMPVDEDIDGLNVHAETARQ